MQKQQTKADPSGMTTRKAKARQKGESRFEWRVQDRASGGRFFGSERPRQVLRYQPPANGLFLDRKAAVTRAPEATSAMPPSTSTFSQAVPRYGLPSLQDRDRERLAI